MGVGLTAAQEEYVARIRSVASDHLLAIPPVHGAVNRPLVAALGEHGLLRGLFGGAADEPLDLLATLPPSSSASSGRPWRPSPPRPRPHSRCRGWAATRSSSPARPPRVERWLPGVVAGSVVAGFALSEPEAGSDAAALSLQATPDGDGWRLHGEKAWISNAPDADVYSVFARTTDGAGARGVTAFVVAGDAEGLGGERLDLLAPHAIGTLTFDGVRVSPDDVLGEVDQGFAVAMRTLDLFRPSVGAFAVGMAQAALDAALDWALTREVYGDLLIRQQSVEHTLAEMATRTEAARLLVRSAATTYDAGAPAAEVTQSAAMAKLFATENAQWVVDQAVQLHGARGLQQGHLLERLYREVRAPRIYEGASEVQRTIIGRGLVRARQSRQGGPS